MKRNIHEIDDHLRRWGAILIAVSLLGGACVGVPLALSDGYRVVTRSEDGTLRERKIYASLERLRREHPDAVSIEPLGEDERIPVRGVVGVTLAILLGGVVLLVVGRRLGAREEKKLAVWRLLERAVKLNDDLGGGSLTGALYLGVLAHWLWDSAVRGLHPRHRWR